ncbi:MAG: amidohydrolase family protein [Acidobacteria bacterium]|nr:amidohydrolase family protein [Acidobacteriota bacterium]
MGGPPVDKDVGIWGDRIVKVAPPGSLTGREVRDVSGLALAPGFINMLSWGQESLLVDGRGTSDVLQGVTLEVFGEGWSMGPLTPAMKAEILKQQADLKFPVPWDTLGGSLRELTKKGVTMNVASFVGATTVRIHELGYENRAPSAEELSRMQGLVDAAMREGAMGLGSSLIYAPASYSKTDELVALCEVVSKHGGLYTTHMRSEGARLLEAVDEVLDIQRRTGVRAEIYHLKAAGESNWPKLAQVVEKIEKARAAGVPITANMYTYTAGATGLDAAMPPWVQEGGLEAWIARLRDPAQRERVVRDMNDAAPAWENLLRAAGSPERVLLVGFKTPALKPLTGKTLAEVATLRGKSPEETAIDLVIEDGSRIETVYFLMSEENVKRQVALPWMSFGSDADAQAPEGPFLLSRPHPRAYGNFARVLGKYVREEKALTLAEAIRKLSALPALNLRIRDRGLLREGFFADIVVFDPAKIADHATFDAPQQLATGVTDVFVNGKAVVKAGAVTAARPGVFVKGPGFRP